MEMLTEVMSVMLFNKDEQLNNIVGRGESLELKSKLPHPSDLLAKRRRRKKASGADLSPQEGGGGATCADKLDKLDNEKSEVSQLSASQMRRREAKLQAKQASQKRPLQERLNGY
mmetsp:Transcript_39932/g.52246  ORF Transcript_39932/g.52246 Transcript_39932/m.52246 type:complete len:115 (+) Transcript_39932:458-802(+)